MREFYVNEGVIESNHSKCLVCKKKFKLGEKIVLCPIQQPAEGYATVMSIPIHTECYWIKK